MFDQVTIDDVQLALMALGAWDDADRRMTKRLESEARAKGKRR